MNIKPGNKKLIVIAIHILGWLLLYFFPIYMRMNSPIDIDLPWQIELKNNIYFLLLVVLFYANYLFLIPKLLFRKKFFYYFLSALTILVLVVLANDALNTMLGVDRAAMRFRSGVSGSRDYNAESQRFSPPYTERRADTTQEGKSLVYTYRSWAPFADSEADTFSITLNQNPRMVIRRPPFDLFSILSTLFVLLLGTGIKFGQQWFKSERQKEEIEKEKLQTELSFLKSQVNPHFFFNMLNNIYSLIGSNPPKAQKSVHKLSKLMRYVLYESARNQVTLEMEIAFIKNYLDLAKIRLPDSTKITFGHVEENVEILIPPLLFVPFLENIFKHGIRQNEPSDIKISLKQTREKIFFYSQNNIFTNSSTNDGIGLKNARRRLDLLYKDRYSLNITEENRQFIVYLIIPVYDH